MKTDQISAVQADQSAPAPTCVLSEFGERVVPLWDGRSGLRGGIHMNVSEPSDLVLQTGPEAVGESSGSACLDFVASDETLDRFDEVIVASGWRLENYRRNPVFQNAHKYGDIIFTLGKALRTEVRAGRLYQRIEFATEVNPMARIAYGLYRGRFLNAVSVGFIPLRWENGDAEAGYRRKYLEQELLEVSAVGIPANPNALQLGLKAGAIDKSDLLELLEITERPIPFCSPPAAPHTSTGAFGVGSYEAQWLQLARSVREALRS